MYVRLSGQSLHFPSSRKLHTYRGKQFLFIYPSWILNICLLFTSKQTHCNSSHHNRLLGMALCVHPRHSSLVSFAEISQEAFKRQSTMAVATWYVGRRARNPEGPNTQGFNTEILGPWALNLASQCPGHLTSLKNCSIRHTQCSISPT